MNNYLQLLRNSSFVKLWGSQIFSQVAQNLLFFALIIRVFELAAETKFANVSVAMLVLAFGIPAILFGPLAGAYVDYWNRKWVLVVSNIARAMLVLAYPLVETNFFLVLAVSFAIATISQFFVPAEAASIPRLVKKNLLVSANALFVLTLYASFIVGYGSSALSIKLAGPHGPYVVAAILWLAATLLDLMLPSLEAAYHKRHKLSNDVSRVMAETRQNLQTILASHKLYFPILQLTITQSVVGIVLALAPAMSLALLKIPLTDSSSLLFLPAGLGLIAGVMLVNNLSSRLSLWQLVALCLVAASIGLTMLGLSGQLYRHIGGFNGFSISVVSWTVAGLLLVLALLHSMISAASQTMLHQATTDETRGKVFGALGMMVNIAATLPVFFAGILADLFSVTKVLTALGVVLTVYAIFQYYSIGRLARPAPWWRKLLTRVSK
ncbi:MAG TPA: MFS transporter [Candidatus Dormibacteraeota bacterium]|nr:MFS transporter [Candidatus Dormibacteraeota bacterium]